MPDYDRNDDYVACLSDELVPWLREQMADGQRDVSRAPGGGPPPGRL
jgi:hypothetical protein